MAGRQKVYLIDGSALAYRSYFAFIRNPLINSKGINTSAVFGFAQSLLIILNDFQPVYLAVVFDTKAPTFRHGLYSEYKSTRSKMPDDMVSQLPYISQVLKEMKLPVLEKEGFEADDLMGALAYKFRDQGLDVVLVTGDKDFMQLVGKGVTILNPHRAGQEMEWIDSERVKEKFGVPPEKIVDTLALMGDQSDNIPGVPGVGEKTALQLMQKFDSLEEILSHPEKIEQKKLREKITFHADQARLSKKLATIDTAAPVELDLKQYRFSRNFDSGLKELFKELELNTLLQQVSGGPDEGVTYNYQLVSDSEKLDKLIAKIKKNKELAFDTETSSLSAIGSDLVGISVALEEGEAYYLPMGHKKGKNLNLKLVIEKLGPLLADPGIKKIGQNAKFDWEVLNQSGMDVNGIGFDTMIASYLLDPSVRQHNLDLLALKYLDHKMIPIEQLIGTGKKQISFSEVPVEDACQYSAEDADCTFRLKQKLAPRLKDLGLQKLFDEVEIPLIVVLGEIELNGIAVDKSALKSVSNQLEHEIEKYTRQIFELAGSEFNLNSPSQLAKVLFEDLKLKPVRRTQKKSHQSTDVQVLEELAKIHPLPKAILEYRQLSKLKSTYADALPLLVNPKTKRIHTSFNQTIAATGRLSSSEPNLQNIPVRTEIGRQIRKAFVPGGKEFLLLSADYSQIELRILAHFSSDPTLTASFAKGEDIHTRTAAEVFGVDPKNVNEEQRRQAKIANFSVIYGVSAYGLSQQTEMTIEEADMFIKVYFKRYPKVAEYIDAIIEKARRDGYVSTLMGRRRFIPEINSSNRQVREFAERVALNTPIQGTAADLIKVVMIKIADEMRGKKTKSKMILQVHDELVFEVHKSELDYMKKMVKEKMENSLKLDVPIKVDLGVGKNWLELEYD
ncbi:MAG: DNA polymerase I [candidate division Zixibacteria bacterium]|nr:DNA polymerase I [candidate division Zixibacteria bacterium]